MITVLIHISSMWLNWKTIMYSTFYTVAMYLKFFNSIMPNTPFHVFSISVCTVFSFTCRVLFKPCLINTLCQEVRCQINIMLLPY